MPLIRKRRAQPEPSPSPSPPPQRSRRSPSESEVSGAENGDGETQIDDETQGSSQQMVKKLVRLALACEYTRQPIRRADITTKVLAPNSGRSTFKAIFAETQHELRTTFGMEMTELPTKEKVTISQKRAAQRSQTLASKSTASYILTSTLPSAYRIPAILPPPRYHSTHYEASYTALYTFIVSLIYLSHGKCSESKLESALARLNCRDYFSSGEKIGDLLKRMERQGYVVKVREQEAGGEQSVEYVVGPRGKVEVGERGAAGLVRTVWGASGTEADEFERKLVRSFGDACLEKKVQTTREADEDEAEEVVEDAGNRDGETNGNTRPRRRTSGRRRRRDEEEDEEDD